MAAACQYRKKVKPRAVVLDPVDEAIIVNIDTYILDTTQVGPDGQPLVVHHKPGQKRIVLKTFHENSSVPKFAAEVVKMCQYIHPSKVPHVEGLLTELQNRLRGGGGAPPQPQANQQQCQQQQPPQQQYPQQPTGAPAPAADDDWGDFDDEPVAAAPAPAPAPAADDDWGDFDDDDEFGDFEAPVAAEPSKGAPVAEVATPVDGDDDDWGDFGAPEPAEVAASGSVATAAPSGSVAAATADVDDDDDDDDFGFEAPVAAEPAPAANASRSFIGVAKQLQSLSLSEDKTQDEDSSVPDVVVSYTTSDDKERELLRVDLEEEEISAWSGKAVNAGKNSWRVQWKQMMRKAGVVAFILSKDFCRSKACGWEIKATLDEDSIDTYFICLEKDVGAFAKWVISEARAQPDNSTSPILDLDAALTGRNMIAGANIKAAAKELARLIKANNK